MKQIFFVLFVFILSGVQNQAQIPVLQWRSHLSYSQGRMVIPTESNVYCLTSGGIFAYNKNDNSIQKLDKNSGLSDVVVTTINYSFNDNLLVIGYENGNIDILKGKQIINVPDIFQKPIIGNKSINNITFYNGYAYLSCGFGIVVLDLSKYEIKESYFIGANGTNVNVSSIAFTDDYIYASTTEGIYKAPLSGVNLANFQNWTKISNIPNYSGNFRKIVYFNHKLVTYYKSANQNEDRIFVENNGNWDILDTSITNISSMSLINGKLIISQYSKATIYSDFNSNPTQYNAWGVNPFDAAYDEKNNLWIADAYGGLVRKMSNHPNDAVTFIRPDGPLTNNCMRIDCGENNLWVARGALTSSWNNQWVDGQIYHFTGETWYSFSEFNSPKLMGIKDICFVKVNPNNHKEAYFGSYGGGLVVVNNDKVVEVYDDNNSPLQNIIPGSPYVRVTGLDFDKEGNLWIVSSLVQNNLTVRKPDGSWKSISLVNAMGGIKITGELYCTSDGIKWIILPKGGGLFAYSENGTLDNLSDDKTKNVSIISSEGEEISNDVYCLAEDKDGLLWVGTAKGLVFYYNPSQVFDNSAFYAQRIKLPNEIEGQANYLFESEVITALAIDGANRKWVGTLSGGVFLMSADCQKEIYHFKTENSPLLSNTINDIAIDPKSGEVFFATDKGICSFRSTATEGLEFHHNVEVFPNPVRPDYNGNIAIRGLVQNAHVKITDIAGNLVFETRAEGGQANWNGKNLSGNRVSTGVYLIFSTNDDGSQTYVTKLLFVN
ncbi:MAG: type IX secretion system anionic LPS delivery protein PorZ [Bacteroidales bacterium]